MRAATFVEYTVAGGVAGAAFNGLGATILHCAQPDQFDRRGAALAGFVGGTATHAVFGILSAFDGQPGMGARLQHLGHSLPLASLTSGAIGGALLGASGRHDHPDLGGMVLSGLLGGAIIGTVALIGTLAATLMCCRRPTWTALASGDLETGERLLSPEAEAHEHAEHEPSTVQRIASSFGRVP